MDNQYYPTGVHTAALMWSKFKRPVKHICDPSAGKGNLIRYADEGFEEIPDDQIPWLSKYASALKDSPLKHRTAEFARSKYQKIPKKSVVEIDVQHHASLRELEVDVIGYDFLEVQSLATVTSVIMNPPFNQGVAHVLHAWDVVYDAEIVAIINAESIKNPFSQDRRRLIGLIEKYGSVEFLEDQFVTDVERTTLVEIALIHLEKVPQAYMDVENLFAGLKEGDNNKRDSDAEVCTALSLPANFISNTYHRFEMAVKAARECSDAMALSEHLKTGLGLTLEKMQAMGVGSDSREIAGNIREAANTEFASRYDDLKQRAWGQIIRSTLLTDRISNQARRQLESNATDIYKLEFTIANIHGFLAGVISSMGDIYRDMVCQLFDTIIERSSDNVVFYKSWKSNQKHRIGVRIRRTRFIIPRFRFHSGGNLEYESQQFLADIDKVFGYLHGISGSYDGLVSAYEGSSALCGTRMQSRFFDFRVYPVAGTIHFYPKSESVVEKINQFVGKLRNWIPSDFATANDDFQRQYDKGESMTKDYLDEYRRNTRIRYGLDCPATQLIRSINGKSFDESEINRLETAIESVHEQLGIQCGEALTSSQAEQLLDTARPEVQSEQMLLLSA